MCRGLAGRARGNWAVRTVSTAVRARSTTNAVQVGHSAHARVWSSTLVLSGVSRTVWISFQVGQWSGRGQPM
ncbi:hypothetical protein DVA86_28130 [Streptomyces armeniacus]|uniref:Uncharacterized protein n=1 Tax=Streptomyces armeniacus TaxID=83291 RepID=A0A345XW89_9ACTN|nr:hypothetical protein DVA86_28130 [Streptomyces armeniacus]